ncbi:MAG TPA: anhydro-N-acetylmuramic acid kinase [Bryobacteraceae bacterium]|jgi:anhydro-N-acetylmuramic acid kinase|nr:anhydro-N-acetylmuramic acid kinase [Bryobacteraceae bacterium]
MRVAGIMSGTSLDGIDVALVDIDARGIQTVAHSTFPYSGAVRERILAVSNARCETAEISRLNFELGGLYAKAVLATCRKSGVAADSIELCGCHGQTIYHEGKGRIPNTLQIGEAAVIAEALGVPVVSDFRTRDIAAGGQGAPLVPFMDYLLFRSAKVHRVALNIGGIANITVLPRGASPESVVAFDTGPGNMTIDQLVARMTGGKQRFDRNGSIGARGRVNRPLLKALLKDRYFRAKPPKTAGREQYGAAFIDKMAASGLSAADLIATATALTAASIAEGVRRFAPETEEVIAAGGGVHNSQLMGQLAAFLPGCRIITTREFGVDPDAKEAIAFAILAWRTWRRKTGNLPGATGAAKSVVLGKVTVQ